MTKKPCFRGSIDRTRQMGRNTLAILIAAHLHYLLITVKVGSLEKVSFSDTQNPKVVCQHIDSQ